MKYIIKEKKERRTFLKNIISAGAGLFATGMFKAKAADTKTVRLLTPDGKLVEVDKSKIEDKIGQIASNREVMNWMNPKSKQL